MAEYNESQINSNETERISAEQQRINNEAQRQTKETEREAREATRQSNENSRISKEAERLAEEVNRQEAEASRATAEQGRVEAENIRAEFYDGFNDRLDSVDSQLAHIENKINIEYDFVVDFGGVPNNPDFDNSVILSNALDVLTENGGCLNIPSGTFWFKTPINKSRLDCILIKGSVYQQNSYTNNRGSVFIYDGFDTFLTFGILHSVWFKNITIKSSNGVNYAFNITDGFYLSGFEHISMVDFKGFINTNKGEYGYFTNCNFMGKTDFTTEYILKLGGSKIFEFVFIDKCTFNNVGGEGNSLLNINSVGFLSVKNSDFAYAKNKACGISLTPTSQSSGNIYIDTCNITHIDYGFVIKTGEKSLFNTHISNCRLFFDVEKDYETVIIAEKMKDSSEVFFDNIYVRSSTGSDIEYFIKCYNKAFTDNSHFHLKNSNILTSGYLKFDLGDDSCLATIDDFRIKKAIETYIEGDGVKTSFDVIMCNVSPFRYNKGIMFNVVSQALIPFRVLTVNTHNSQLICRIIFSTPPDEGHYRLYVENTLKPIDSNGVW